jgi:hypothetical protein
LRDSASLSRDDEHPDAGDQELQRAELSGISILRANVVDRAPGSVPSRGEWSFQKVVRNRAPFPSHETFELAQRHGSAS